MYSAPPDHVDFDAEPLERLSLANQQAFEAAKEPAIRHVALEALRGVGNIPTEGPARLARWVRGNIRYAEEAPGVELLQGPFSTLAYKLGDCDDLAILWAALGRSVGLDLYVAGVAYQSEPGVLRHAVGYDAGSGRHYELSKDRRWHGPLWQPLLYSPPSDCYVSIWSPVDQQFRSTWPMRTRLGNPDPSEIGTYYEGAKNGATAQSTWVQEILSGIGSGLGTWARRSPELVYGPEGGPGYIDGGQVEEVAVVEPPAATSVGGIPTSVLALAGIGLAVGLVIWLAKR